MTDQEIKILLNDIKWTPSAHNSQPLRLRIDNDDISVFADNMRFLPAADPHYKDLEMSLGALVEGLDLSLSTLRYEIVSYEKREFFKTHKPKDCLLKIKIKKTDRKTLPLSAYLDKRFSYRGKFEKSNGDINKKLKYLPINLFAYSTDQKLKEKISTHYDRVNIEFLLRRGYIEELYSWMRFKKNNPRYSQDGLNAPAMELSGIEAWGASVVLKPQIFRMLNSLKLASLIVTEKPVITSASALILVKAPKGATYLEQGRLFYRAWLELTKNDIYGAPLSILTDDPASVEFVKKSFPDTENFEFVNLFRAGPLPTGYQRYAPARLQPTEFLRGNS